MEQTEIRELLDKMGALRKLGEAVDPGALMVDPIVTNRLAVELLQQVNREWKPELVVSLEGVSSYFGYSVALAAWMRFTYATHNSQEMAFAPYYTPKKKEKVLIVLDTFDETLANSLIDLVKRYEAKPYAVLCLVSGGKTQLQDIPVLSLL